MPRHQRVLSKTAVYHIMLRGNERKNVFGSDDEKRRFLEDVLIKQKEISFTIYAYCVMDNHVHIVINTQDNDISSIMKGIAIRYAYFYNAKHRRVGHVFQDRFKSETVEDERYLMSVVRYVHNNPVKAKMVNLPEEYRWSSYSKYVRRKEAATGIVTVDTGFILGIIAEDRQVAIKEFVKYSAEEDSASYLDCEDEDVIRTIEQGREYLTCYISKEYGEENWANLKQDSIAQKEIIRHLRANTKLSIRTIGELLEVDRNTVQRTRY